MSYYNIYTLENKSSLSLINDAQVLWNYSLYGNGGQPSKIEKEYSNFYEFILTNGEKKILILEDIITSSIVDQVTDNNKSLLKKVYISNSCTSIENECFKNCDNLEYVSYTNVENSATVALTAIGNSAFENCNMLDECRLFNIIVPITTIGDSAFKLCSKLFEVQLENTQINSIGDNAFNGCSNLVTIYFPATLSFMGTSAFSGTSLVNIYFNGPLPATIGSTLFGTSGTPLNAICYYYGNYINGSSYTSLKNLFPNNNQIVFIEVNNNTIENRETFYSITNNGVNSNIITKASEILDSLLIRRIGGTSYTIDLAYDNTLSGTNTLGYASWGIGQIRLNPDNDTGSNVNLNGISLSLNTVVLVHEILHIFGFGTGTLWNNIRSYDTALDYYLSSKNAVYQYNKLLLANGYEKKVNYLTVEDSGDYGTMGGHTEEGYYFNTVTDSNGSTTTYSNPQMRADNKGNVYPSVQNDIMSGYLGNNNFFTRQCCGVLQDLEFTINYNSPWFYNGSISFYPSVIFDNINIKTDFNFNIENLNNEENIENIKNTSFNHKQQLIKKYNFKCNCCNDETQTASLIKI